MKHATRKVGHEGRCLQVEVPYHLVGAQSAKESDYVGVDVRAEQSASTSGLEAAGSNIGGKEAQRGAQESHSSAERSGDFLGFDKGPVGSYVVAAKWCSRSSSV